MVLTPTLDAQDATFVRLNQLAASVNVASTSLSLSADIGVLGASVTGGSLTLSAVASVAIADTGSAGALLLPVSQIIGTNAADLLTVTPTASMLTATLPLTATFGDLGSDTASIVLSGDPLSGTAPSISITGPDAANFIAFGALTPGNLVGALSSIGSALTGIESSSLLAAQVPFTSLSVGQVADFGTDYASTVVSALTNADGDPTFTDLKQFTQDLRAVSGLTGLSTTYDSNSDQFEVAFNLAEAFATTPATFNYDLSATAGTLPGDLSDVIATTGTLSVGGGGTVSVAFGFNLASPLVQVTGGMALPTTGVLPTGDDAHFNLSLSAPGATPTVVPSPSARRRRAGTRRSRPWSPTSIRRFARRWQAPVWMPTWSPPAAPRSPEVRRSTLTLAAGAFTAFSVSAAPLDPAVYTLGLTPAQTPIAEINSGSALPSNGRLAADATFTITADGGAATPLTITAASTSGNTNRTQLLAQVNSALTALNASLKAADRLPVMASLTSSGALSFAISGYGGTLEIVAPTSSQIGLGLPATQSVESAAPAVSVEASGGSVPSATVGIPAHRSPPMMFRPSIGPSRSRSMAANVRRDGRCSDVGVGVTVSPATGVAARRAARLWWRCPFRLLLWPARGSPTVVPVTVNARGTQGNTAVSALVDDVETVVQNALRGAGLHESLCERRHGRRRSGAGTVARGGKLHRAVGERDGGRSRRCGPILGMAAPTAQSRRTK